MSQAASCLPAAHTHAPGILIWSDIHDIAEHDANTLHTLFILPYLLPAFIALPAPCCIAPPHRNRPALTPPITSSRFAATHAPLHHPAKLLHGTLHLHAAHRALPHILNMPDATAQTPRRRTTQFAAWTHCSAGTRLPHCLLPAATLED